MNASRSKLLGLFLLWFVLVLLAIGLLALIQRDDQLAALDRESTLLHRHLSQRVGQHDAHLTSLSAIATAADKQRADLFLAVAATISRFYPRIDEVQLVPLIAEEDVIGSQPLDPNTATLVRKVAQHSTGQPTILPHPNRDDHYMLIKRSPNTDNAIYALMIGIDINRLIESESDFWQHDATTIRLQSPDGRSLFSNGETGHVDISNILASPTQPLLLKTGIHIGIADLLKPAQVIGAVLLVTIALSFIVSGYRQRTRARMAEREAALSKVDAQLAHASRVNIMGEMASGMAHELTQPLTAILAQAQVGKRLLNNGDLETLAPTLEATAAQARRASAILERLRNWTRPSGNTAKFVDLRLALRNVAELLSQEAVQRQIKLLVDDPKLPIEIKADQVEMEQVLHNLIRNAFNALDGRADGRITVNVSVSNEQVTIDVADNGPGVPEEFIPSLFIPFMTNREDGSGLGLALSQRLVERAEGEISIVENRSHTMASHEHDEPRAYTGAIFRVVLPLRAKSEKSLA